MTESSSNAEENSIEILEAPSLYADIALAVPHAEPYQYSVPSALQDQVKIGRRVRVPLRQKTRIGYVVSFSHQPEVETVKPILEVIDEETYVGEKLLKLTRWMADYYYCSWGQTLEAAMPAPFKKGKTFIKARKSKDGDQKEWVHAEPPHQLSADQLQAYTEIKQSCDRREYKTFLLHGVTGSGKTEIYLHLIDELLKAGRGAIVLVPEISLTPQTTDRFESRFQTNIAVLHSRLSAGKRLNAWHRIQSGQAKVVVGARSAIFSPVQNLGLVIIDEEHDDSYKQNETPRYDTIQVAQKRCEIEEAVLIRGSATPRLESMYAAEQGELTCVKLPHRIGKRPMPEVNVVDMQRLADARFNRIFSYPLESAIQTALESKEQVILFLNRRGFAPFVTCRACGWVAKCPKCQVSLVFHQYKKKLICHTCRHTDESPKICPNCEKGYLRYLGVGTEKIESEMHRLFPSARIARMDSDSTTRVGSHDVILKKFRKREIDVLLGTQMIAKGHDFPGVSVIGVISADTALHLPDFRAAERTFDLLTQVAGRAGRENIQGRVFVQTYVPDHYAILAAKDHDYDSFYKKEMEFRRELRLPPYRHVVQVVVAGRDARVVVRQSWALHRLLEGPCRAQDIDLLGPAQCLFGFRRGLSMWNVFLRAHSVPRINELLRESILKMDRKGVMLTVNADPR